MLLRDFRHRRLTELAERQEEGAEAAWAAWRLVQSTDRATLYPSDFLALWGMVVDEGRTEEAGFTQRLRQDIRMWWNELCLTADQFSEHPDHLPRWRNLEQMCLEHAEWKEQLNDGFSAGTYQGGAHP
ncbi:hypothetical protein ACFXKW_23780 [Streptomyces sp. NPDC059193]|uniref:hypothetical protein n=1 Tax=Streptomyces sp. NPDC059193 TaxID=3346763 RepID=UPI0036C642AD